MTLLKHLIHIFWWIILVSFVFMIFIVANREDEFDGIDQTSETSSTAKTLAKIISMHPLIFGFSQGAKVVGYSNTEEMRK